ncbi:MAG: twitch domain-containing radical SAM protein [Pseudobdellovibrio sp.]
MIKKKHLDFKNNVLDSISPTLCAAKWLDSTIWLYSGLTVSCHHPPSHKIDLNEIEANPSAIHNTREKKQARLEMQEGKRPKECEYCWKIEDLSKEHISDRVFKSLQYNSDELKKLKDTDYKQDVNLKTLEIAFDRTCNFACSYCNPSYSTRWVKDITDNGPYQNLQTDKRDHYVSTHAGSDPYFGKEINPYVEAFWKWWPELKKSLTQLRITGGEPMMSPHFWKLLEVFKADGNLNINLAVNSNLGGRDELIDKFIKESHHINHLEIYTSNESYGEQAEYIRDGLNYEKWKNNIERLLTEGNVKRMHVMMTINGLCLFSITELLDQFLAWKLRFGYTNPTISLNILRWPTFQSALALPMELRLEVVGRIKVWFEKNKNSHLLMEYEIDQLKRLIDYLERATEATDGAASQEDLAIDLKRFLLQYDKRRNKNYNLVFEERVTSWLNSIQL